MKNIYVTSILFWFNETNIRAPVCNCHLPLRFNYNNNKATRSPVWRTNGKYNITLLRARRGTGETRSRTGNLLFLRRNIVSTLETHKSYQQMMGLITYDTLRMKKEMLRVGEIPSKYFPTIRHILAETPCTNHLSWLSCISQEKLNYETAFTIILKQYLKTNPQSVFSSPSNDPYLLL